MFSLNLFDAAAKKAQSNPRAYDIAANCEALCSAAWDNKITEVQRLLGLEDVQSFVNVPNSRGQAALYCAARWGSVSRYSNPR